MDPAIALVTCCYLLGVVRVLGRQYSVAFGRHYDHAMPSGSFVHLTYSLSLANALCPTYHK